MEILIRLGAGFNQRPGNPRLLLNLPDGATIDDLITEMRNLQPELEGKLSFAVPVIAGRHVAGNEPLSDHQEVALLLPVSGG